MKKITLLTIVFLTSTICTACGGKADSPTTAPAIEATTQAQTSTAAPTTTRETATETIAIQNNTLADLENYLLNNNVLSGKRTEMAADMVGGIAGFKYSEPKIEIYEYDINSEEYKTLSSGGEISLQGFENVTVKAAAINSKFVMFGDIPQKSIDIFNSYGK